MGITKYGVGHIDYYYGALLDKYTKRSDDLRAQQPIGMEQSTPSLVANKPTENKLLLLEDI